MKWLAGGGKGRANSGRESGNPLGGGDCGHSCGRLCIGPADAAGGGAVDFKQDSPRGCWVVAGVHGADGAERRRDTISLSAKLFYLPDEHAGEGGGEFGDDVRTT